MIRKYEFPPDLLYTEEHEWIRIRNGIGDCGITDYAQKSLSDIVYVELPQVNREVKKGEVVCTIESVKSVSDVFSPVDGTIKEINHRLKQEPNLINQSPYGDGWIFRIEIKGSKDGLLSAEEYKKLIEKIEGGK